MSVHICPDCQCERRSGYEDAAQARHLIDQLVAQYGSLRAAGRAYSERYGLYWVPGGQSSGERLFERIRLYQATVSTDTLDRIEVFAAS